MPTLIRWILCAVLAAFCGQASSAGLFEGKNRSRIVLVGDSITGLSRNQKDGFAHLMDEALPIAHPGSEVEIVALGGSGQPVSGWLKVESDSRTKEVMLDVPGVGVKAALDQPADVLVVMLGMNDALAPYVDASATSLDAWIDRYEKLLDLLRKRVNPGTLAVGSVTLCTEDLASPKNQLIDAMNQRLRALAAKSGAIYLETSQVMKDLLAQGRRGRPDFHTTRDFVHPNGFGHLAIAIGMLRGLGEEGAAQWLTENKLEPLLKKSAGDSPTLSWQLIDATPVGNDGNFCFRIHYDWADQKPGDEPEVKLIPPTGWKVSPELLSGNTGEFTLTGRPDRLRNEFELEGNAGQANRKVRGWIPAPWLVAAGLIQTQWKGDVYEVEKGRTPIDGAIEEGSRFIDVPAGEGHSPLSWQTVFPSVNYNGGESSSNVDFFAISNAANFEAGYAARWIYSETDRDVKLKLASKMFGGQLHLTLWVNGGIKYQGDLIKESGKQSSVTVSLHRGWNALVFKANHRTWLWQCSVSLEGMGNDDLSDIRYAIQPEGDKR